MTHSINHSLLAENDANVIRAELDRLLTDRRFSGARQMSNFLRYIVSQTLNGNGSRIKAYTVGVDALGKPHDFDAQADPSVRVLALRLRKTLASAYEDDTPCFTRIVLRVGSYVPEFYKPEAFIEADPRQILQSPDHASVDQDEIPSVDDNPSRGTADSTQGNRMVNRHAEGHRQPSLSVTSLDSVRIGWTSVGAIRPNSLARVRIAPERCDRLNAWLMLTLLLASWMFIGNPVSAGTTDGATALQSGRAAVDTVAIPVSADGTHDVLYSN